jgi:hypothetical protein
MPAWQVAGGVAAKRGGDVAVAVGVQDADGQGCAGWHGAAAEMTSVQQPP